MNVVEHTPSVSEHYSFLRKQKLLLGNNYKFVATCDSFPCTKGQRPK